MLLDRLVRLLLHAQDSFFTLLEGIAGKITEAAAVFDELAFVSGHETIRGHRRPTQTD